VQARTASVNQRCLRRSRTSPSRGSLPTCGCCTSARRSRVTSRKT
jgi:hypothetical protein